MLRRTIHTGDSENPAVRKGFTLIEVLIATALIGLGVTALLVAAQSGTQVNMAGRDITQATYLAQEVREWTLKLPFSDPDDADAGNPPGPDGSDPLSFVDDLDDMIEVVYSPPRDASGGQISGLDGWTQRVNLEWKDPDSLLTTVSAGSSDVVRVVVTVEKDGRAVLSTGWLVTRRESE